MENYIEKNESLRLEIQQNKEILKGWSQILEDGNCAWNSKQTVKARIKFYEERIARLTEKLEQ